MRRTMTLIFVALILVLVAVSAGASKRTLSIQASDVAIFTPDDDTLGRYYTFSVPTPEGLTSTRVERVVLEFYVDVAAKLRQDYVTAVPMIEIRALPAEISPETDISRLETTAVAARPVAAGSNRRVRVDVTDVIREYLATPSRNHGLLVGSLTGSRAGDFTVKPFRDGSVARLYIEIADLSR